LSNKPKDKSIIDELLDLMQRFGVDYTLVMRGLCSAVKTSSDITELSDKFSNAIEFEDWVRRWRDRLQLGSIDPNEIIRSMKSINPVFIPRNHLIENVIQSAVGDNDFKLFQDLLLALSNPFEDNKDFMSFKLPPKSNEIVHQTYCGT